jgi:hypothetical protein
MRKSERTAFFGGKQGDEKWNWVHRLSKRANQNQNDQEA